MNMKKEMAFMEKIDAKANVNADNNDKVNVNFDDKNDDIYKIVNMDKLVIRTKITTREDELLRKTMYFKQKNWDSICLLASKTRNSKTAVINAIIEYALNHMTIE